MVSASRRCNQYIPTAVRSARFSPTDWVRLRSHTSCSMDNGLRNIIRTVIVIGLAVGLIAVFLRNADLGRVWSAVAAARADFLALSVVLTALTFVIRAERWQYLLEPLGPTRFRIVFRTTVIGFAASAVLPARAGEVIRPYLLARQEGLSATAAFATILVERMLDLVAVLLLLAGVSGLVRSGRRGAGLRRVQRHSLWRTGDGAGRGRRVVADVLHGRASGAAARVAAQGRADSAGARRGGDRQARANVR